jgi:hypothetical protein
VYRLFKTILILGVLGMAAWMAWTVKLGDRTLVEHIRAIANTEESQRLLKGTKEKVGSIVDQAEDKVVDKVAKHVPGKVTARGDGDQEGAVPQAPPQEDLSAEDRKALRRMIGQGRPQPSQ